MIDIVSPLQQKCPGSPPTRDFHFWWLRDLWRSVAGKGHCTSFPWRLLFVFFFFFSSFFFLFFVTLLFSFSMAPESSIHKICFYPIAFLGIMGFNSLVCVCVCVLFNADPQDALPLTAGSQTCVTSFADFPETAHCAQRDEGKHTRKPLRPVRHTQPCGKQKNIPNMLSSRELSRAFEQGPTACPRRIRDREVGRSRDQIRRAEVQSLP